VRLDPEDVRRGRDVALVVLFAAAVSLPLAGTMLPRSAPPATENRRAAPAPAFPRDGTALASLPAKVEAWFNDRFAFRAELIRWYNRAAVQWLGTAPPADRGFADSGLAWDALGNLSSKVLLGRAGWLFLSGRGRLESYRRADPFSPVDLALLERRFAARRDWLAARGIAYLFVVAPDKHNVYREFMPASVTPVRPRSQLDQLVQHLAGHASVDLLDLKPALLAAKGEGPLYPRTDSHWGELGAWVGYREILARLAPRFPGLEPWPLADFALVPREGDGGDLAKLLGLPDLLRERWVRLVPRRPRAARVVVQHHEEECPEAVWRVTEHPDGRLPAAVLLHDSFMFALADFLSEHFRRAAYHLYREFDPALIARERPDVVIELVAERTLVGLPRKAPPDLLTPPLASGEPASGGPAGD
jgi:hypothetical protein